MCGIAGFYGSNSYVISDEQIENCLQLMKRRGPDSKGIYKDEKCLLLNTRLKIIDLDDRSNLPFVTNDSVFAYNGELYNYKELSAKEYSLDFSTTSDTEVFVKTLGSGFENIEYCDGMWAFALYDKKKKNLILCRDRFGEKPLYIYQNADGVYFGSEIKFIQALLKTKLEVNYNQVYRFLINGYRALYKDVTETFFKGVEQIRPGWGLVIDKRKQREDFIYWNNKKKYEQDESLSFKDSTEMVREELIKVVEKRLRADIPIAFCQSGGVDSSALISIAKKIFKYDVHGFTIASKDKRYNENEIVNQVVKEFGVKHTQVNLSTNNFIQKMRTIIKYHDAPVYTISYYAHWLLMNAVSDQGYKVSISGTAGDELFSGYYDHYHYYFHEVKEHVDEFDSWRKNVLPIIRNPILQDFSLFQDNPYYRDYLYDKGRFNDCLLIDWKEDFAEENYCKDILRNRMLNELFHEVIPQVLHEDDLNSMYFSIENRSPFLDKNLFDLVNKIPTRHLIQNGYGKAVLREAMRGIVPEVVLNSRQKMGFNAPIQELFNIDDSRSKKWLFGDSSVWDILDREETTNILSGSTRDNADSKFLFNLINIKLFLEEFES